MVLSCHLFTGNAQSPERKAVALITEQTCLACVNCGSWGYDFADQIQDSLNASGNGIFMGIYNVDQGITGIFGEIETFQNGTGIRLEQDPTFAKSGNPNFMMNVMPISNNGTINVDLFFQRIDEFATTDPVASSAADYFISGNTITSRAKAKFWVPTDGAYYMASYVVEDSLLYFQAGLPGGFQKVAHNAVLRGSMSGSAAFGVPINTGAVTAGEEVTRNYSIGLESDWNKDKLKMFTVIWKKDGNKYKFINAALSKAGTPASVNELADARDITLFPNPVYTDNVTLSFTAKKAMNLDLNISDIMGRIVYTSGKKAMIAGSNSMNIPTHNLSNGLYYVMLSSGEGRTALRLSVVK